MKSQQSRNALRCLAKRVNEEIRNQRRISPKMNPDIISTAVLDQHEKTAVALGFNRLWLTWEVGVLNGVFEDK